MTRVRQGFAMVLLAAAGLSAADEPAPPEALRLFVGDMQVIPGPDVSDVAVGNSAVATVAPLDRRGLLVTARDVGETTLRLWRGDRQQVYAVQVFPENIARIHREISELIAQMPGVRLGWAGQNLVVDGRDVAESDRRKLARILAVYPSVINLLDEKPVSGQRMVYMDVRILELSRSGVTRLGVDWSDDMAGPGLAVAGDLHKSSGFQKGTVPGLASVPAGPAVSPFQSYFGLATRLDSRINLLEQSGDAVMVAHPILSCRNLGKATFLSGGQVPFTAASATGTPSVEFKDYGIKLDIEPVLGEGGTIFARIAAEVSDLDKATVAGGTPGLLTRKTETEFNMPLGRTIVLSGLVSKTSGQDVQAVPWLGRLPWIGRLFRSEDRLNRRTELVIFVTPMVYGDKDAAALEDVRQVSDTRVRRETGDSQLLGKTPSFSPVPPSTGGQ